MTKLQLQFLDLDNEPVVAALTETGIRFAVDPEKGPLQITHDSLQEPGQAKLIANELGCWLHVYGERNAVHLNGRPVRRLAWVRAGDRIFVDGHSFYVIAEPDVAVESVDSSDAAADLPKPKFALRGLSSEHYAQTIAVQGELRIGTDAASDIRLPSGTGESHIAVASPGPDGLRFAVEPSHTSQVNGRNVRTGLLEVGDQWVIDGRHRYLLESPDFVVIQRPVVEDEELIRLRLSEAEYEKRQERNRLLTRLAWVVGICAAISALMVALILYAPR